MNDATLKILDGRFYETPTKFDVAHAMTTHEGVYSGFMHTLRLLLLAGFCLLICVPACGQGFIVTERHQAFVVTDRTVTPAAVQKQWYLASESWCINCPAAKARFLAKGWPESNVLTIAECKARFGIVVRSVPYEFEGPEPVSSAAPERTQTHIDAEKHLLDEHRITVSGLTLEQMEVIHDKAHGGSSYHFPGRVSMPTSQPVSSSSRNCPGGVCPTQRRVIFQLRPGRWRQ